MSLWCTLNVKFIWLTATLDLDHYKTTVLTFLPSYLIILSACIISNISVFLLEEKLLISLNCESLTSVSRKLKNHHQILTPNSALSSPYLTEQESEAAGKLMLFLHQKPNQGPMKSALNMRAELFVIKVTQNTNEVANLQMN